MMGLWMARLDVTSPSIYFWVHWIGAIVRQRRAAQFVAQLLDLLGIAGCAETFGEIKEWFPGIL
jgi:hypothetical protein